MGVGAALHAGGIADHVVLFTGSLVLIEQPERDRTIVDGRRRRAWRAELYGTRVADDDRVPQLHAKNSVRAAWRPARPRSPPHAPSAGSPSTSAAAWPR